MSGTRLMWAMLFALAAMLVILIARHDAGTIGGFDNADVAALTVAVLVAVMLIGGVFTMFRGQLGRALEAAAFWLVLGLVIGVGYTYRTELGDISRRVYAGFVPGEAISSTTPAGARVVRLTKQRNGEFRIQGRVNGAETDLVLDTGASSVVLTHETARAAGLPVDMLRFDVPVDTANGRTRAAAVTVELITVGIITERRVPVLVAQPGQLRTNLLGMTFLTRLESYEVRGDQLTLRGFP